MNTKCSNVLTIFINSQLIDLECLHNLLCRRTSSNRVCNKLSKLAIIVDHFNTKARREIKDK